jgi:Rrf2 family protein
MLKLTKKLFFAVEAVVDIAYNAGAEPVRSTEISRRQGIPRRYLEQVLQQLVHHQILAGQRGPRGGYRLARERRRISIGDIARVVQGLDSKNGADDDHPGSEIGREVVEPIWSELQEAVLAQMDSLTIEELCRRAQDRGIARESRQHKERFVDFSI